MSGINAPAQPIARTPAECRQSIQGTVALTDRINAIGECRRPEENTRMNTFLNETYKVTDLFTNENIIYDDLISTGDRLFGSAASSRQLDDIQKRNQELIDIKNKLNKENNSLKGVSEQKKRDFVDEKTQLPEPLPNKVLHTIEDYTIGVFLMTYIFMAIALIYYYSAINMFTLQSIGFGLFLSVVVSLILFVLLYNIL
jgi:hypothetical protein